MPAKYDVCGVKYQTIEGVELQCTFRENHGQADMPGTSLHSWTWKRNQDDLERMQRNALLDGFLAAIQSGQLDGNLEEILAAAHGRKRARRF